GRELTRLLDPPAPLAVGEVAVEVEVYALGRQRGDVGRVEADRPPWHDRVDRPVSLRAPRRRLAGEPLALRQVAVEDDRGDVARRRRDDAAEPLAHLRAGIDEAVGAGVQVDEQRPGAFFNADERALLEVPHER